MTSLTLLAVEEAEEGKRLEEEAKRTGELEKESENRRMALIKKQEWEKEEGEREGEAQQKIILADEARILVRSSPGDYYYDQLRPSLLLLQPPAL